MQLQPGGFSPSFLPAERTYATDQEVPIDSSSEQVKVLFAECMGRPFSRCVASAALPLLAILVGLVLLVSICNRSRAKVAEPEPRGRRLADGESDEESPSSPELELLCAAAQEWTPVDPSPGQTRDSPRFVEAFFESLEKPAPPEQEEAATSQPAPGRPADDTDEEQAGPSRKFVRTDDGRHPAAAPPPAFSGGPAAPSTSSTSYQGPAASSQAQPGPAPPGILPVSGDGPSTSTAMPAPATPQGPSGAGQVHPYVRRPALPPGFTARPWRAEIIFSDIQVASDRVLLLQRIRRLLRQAVLGPSDAEMLMETAEQLANYARHNMRGPPTVSKPCRVLHHRALKFIVVNAIHDAAKVFSQELPAWWLPFAETVLQDCPEPEGTPSAGRRVFSRLLEPRIRAALAKYKCGQTPPPEDVAYIMTKLFSDRDSPAAFQAPEWDLWIEDGGGASQ